MDVHQWKPHLKQLTLDVCSLGLELLWMLLYISSGVYPKVGQGQPFSCIFSFDGWWFWEERLSLAMVSSSWYIYKVTSVGRIMRTGVTLEGKVLMNDVHNKNKEFRRLTFLLIFKIIFKFSLTWFRKISQWY